MHFRGLFESERTTPRVGFRECERMMRARRSGRSARLQPCASSCATSRLGCHMAQHEPSSARFQANRDIIPLTRESCRPNDDTDNMSWVTHSLCSHLVTFGAVCPTHGEVFNTRDMIPSMISKTCLAVWRVAHLVNGEALRYQGSSVSIFSIRRRTDARREIPRLTVCVGSN